MRGYKAKKQRKSRELLEKLYKTGFVATVYEQMLKDYGLPAGLINEPILLECEKLSIKLALMLGVPEVSQK